MKPKYTKYKKYHSPKIKNTYKRGDLIHTNYGIVARESSFITGKQIEALSLTLKRSLKRKGKLIFRVFPHRSKTKKPIEVRMGKGKGGVSEWLQPVVSGSLIVELEAETELIARTTLKLVKSRLPFKTHIVIKRV